MTCILLSAVSWRSELQPTVYPEPASWVPAALPSAPRHLRLSVLLFLPKFPNSTPTARGKSSDYCPLTQGREAWRRCWPIWMCYGRIAAQRHWLQVYAITTSQSLGGGSPILNQPSPCHIFTVVSLFKQCYLCFRNFSQLYHNQRQSWFFSLIIYLQIHLWAAPHRPVNLITASGARMNCEPGDGDRHQQCIGEGISLVLSEVLA